MRRIRELLEETLVPMVDKASVFDLAVVSFLAGLGEELLFRGIIQFWLTLHTGPLIALLLASVAFGLAHAVTRIYVVMATLIGFYLGSLMLATDSLVPPIMAHALYDFCGLLYIRHHYRQSGR